MNKSPPTLEELSLMAIEQKDELFLQIFERLNAVENRIEKIENNPNEMVDSTDRRKFSRTKIPVVNSSFCEFTLPVPKNDSSREYKQCYEVAINKIKHNHDRYGYCPTTINSIHFRLFDISVAGCSLLNHDVELSYFLMPHKIYENCKIITPDQGEILISFEIMSKRSIECFDAHQFNELIGIKFLDVVHQHASNYAKKRNKIRYASEYDIVK